MFLCPIGDLACQERVVMIPMPLPHPPSFLPSCVSQVDYPPLPRPFVHLQNIQSRLSASSDPHYPTPSVSPAAGFLPSSCPLPTWHPPVFCRGPFSPAVAPGNEERWTMKEIDVHWVALPCQAQLCMKVLLAQLCPILLTPWIVTCQASLSMEFSKQEYWSRLPFLSPGDLPNPGIKPRSPELQANCIVWATRLPGVYMRSHYSHNTKK